MLRTILAGVLVGCAAASPAQAGWKIDRAQAVASKATASFDYECEGRVAVSVQPGDLSAVARADRRNCAVVVRPDALAGFDWMTFCTLMIHEYGHLAGYRDEANAADPHHSLNPLSIMYAAPSSDRRCRRRGRPYLRPLVATVGSIKGFRPSPPA